MKTSIELKPSDITVLNTIKEINYHLKNALDYKSIPKHCRQRITIAKNQVSLLIERLNK